jgi:hypothetical protein
MNDAEIRLQVKLDTNQASQNVQNLDNKTKKLSDSFKKAGAILTVGLTAPIVAFTVQAVKSASDLQETLNKVDVAFGNSSEEIKEWAKTSIKQFGMAEQTALDMTALYGDMATGMGVNQKEASKLGKGLTGLAGDLASFKNVQLDVAKTALAGVFTGETESLKQLGIIMTQDNLQMFAMQKGMLKNTTASLKYKDATLKTEKAQKELTEAVKKYGANSLQAREATNNLDKAQENQEKSASASIDTMTEAEKIQLRYAYVVDRSKNAVGDFARTSDSTANQIRTAQETYKQMSAELGQNLLPTVNKVIGALTKLLQWFSSLDESTQNSILILAGLSAILGPLAGGIGIVTGAIAWLGTVTGLTNIPLTALLITIGLLSGGILALITNWSKMSGLERVTAVLGVLTIAAVGAAIAVGALQSAWTLGIAAAAIVAGVSAIAYSVSNAQKRAQDSVPKLATGTNNVQREGLAYLHEGEAVVPKKYNPAIGGFNNNQTLMIEMPDIYMDNEKVGRAVTPSISRTLRLAGAR